MEITLSGLIRMVGLPHSVSELTNGTQHGPPDELLATQISRFPIPTKRFRL